MNSSIVPGVNSTAVGSGSSRSHTNAYWYAFIYIAATLVLCGPSILALGLEPFDIGSREFDPFLGMFGSPTAGRVLHSVLFVLLGWLYIRITRLPSRPPLWLAPLSVGIWFLSVPWISPDVFFYLAKGWMEAHYGLDPYTVRISSIEGFATDAIFQSVVPALNTVLGNYGPRFQDLSRVIAILSAGSPVTGLMLFKLVGLVALFGISHGVRRLASMNGTTSTMLADRFWLNPLILASFVGAAHNDVFITAAMIYSVILIIRRLHLAGGLALGFAISLKLSAIFISPAVLLVPIYRRQGIRITMRDTGAILLGLIMGVALGFAYRPEAIGYFGSWMNNDTQYFRSSIFQFLVPAANETFGVGAVNVPLIGKGLFVVLGLATLWRNLLNSKSEAAFVTRSAFELLVLGQLLAMQMMNEWYLLWAIVFALPLLCNATNAWIEQLSLIYMPAVVWAIVGIPALVIATQALITTAFVLSAGLYFINRPESESLIISTS